MVYMHKKTTMNRKMSDMKQKRRREKNRKESLMIYEVYTYIFCWWLICNQPFASTHSLSLRLPIYFISMGMSGCALLLLLGGDWEPVRVPAVVAAAATAADIYIVDKLSSSEFRTLVEITIC